jgi:hypothetical protein
MDYDVCVEDVLGQQVCISRADPYGFEVTTTGVPLLGYSELLALHREIGKLLGLGSPAPASPLTASRASASAHAGQVRR